MTAHRRPSMIAALLTACAILAPSTSSAQDWPTRTITVVVPLGAGSASDIMARVVMDQVSRQVGQTIVVENRPGAGGTIGANMVAKSAPDGYTILAYGALGTAHALHTASSAYDTLRGSHPGDPVRHPAARGHRPRPRRATRRWATWSQTAKAKPGTINYSSAGVGSASHFGAERLRVRGRLRGGCTSRSRAHRIR